MSLKRVISQVAPNGPCSSCNLKGYVGFETFVMLNATSHRIELESMSLDSIPFDLSLAADAYRLSLDNNSIRELPFDWRPLVNLVELRLNNNKIACPTVEHATTGRAMTGSVLA